MDMRTALQIAKEIDVSDIRTDARTIMEAYEDAFDGNDFTVDFGRIEYRIIADDEIEEIHRREIEELVDNCYDLDACRKTLGSAGQYLTFDYAGFAETCREDGYGQHFASYDGEEIEVGDYHIFRIH